MEILIRPVPHACYEPIDIDAISCTYDVEGVTLMNAVLIQHRLDREYFRKCAHMHAGEKFRVATHGDKKPVVITTTKTERWDSEPNATLEIVRAAEAAQCESLCMTHFAFILGKFPKEAFTQCMLQLEQVKNTNKLKKIVVDVDEHCIELAMTVHQSVKAGGALIN